MNPFALSGLLAGLTSLAFGYFVYLKGKGRPLNRLWFVFTASVAVWGFGGMWIALANTPSEALLAWRLAFACGVLWPRTQSVAPSVLRARYSDLPVDFHRSVFFGRPVFFFIVLLFLAWSSLPFFCRVVDRDGGL